MVQNNCLCAKIFRRDERNSTFLGRKCKEEKTKIFLAEGVKIRIQDKNKCYKNWDL